MHGPLGAAQDHQFVRLAAGMHPVSMQPTPFADAAAGTAAAAAFTVSLPPIRTGFGSPIKGSPVKKVVHPEAKGMATSASFSDWAQNPVKQAAKPNRQRSSLQPPAAKVRAAGSSLRGAAMLGVILLVLVLGFAIARAAASPSSARQQPMQEAKLQFRAEEDVLALLLDPNATAPSAAEDADSALQPDTWQSSAEDGSSSSGISRRRQARRLLRSAALVDP